MGVTVCEDGGVDVSRVLETRERFERVSEYARCVSQKNG